MKTYILKKDCPKIGKEAGDYYNGEYRESIEELLTKGIIEEEDALETRMKCGCDGNDLDQFGKCLHYPPQR